MEAQRLGNKFKQCLKCKEVKLITQFFWSGSNSKHRSRCKECYSEGAAGYYKRNRDKILADNKRWRDIPENRERMRARVRAWHYKFNYGMSEEEKIQLLLRQNGECAICHRDLSEIPKQKSHVDHCHKDGHIRGILCHNCNQILGQSKDNVEILESAIEYLQNSRDVLKELRHKEHP